jgi:hypothetical protein
MVKMSSECVPSTRDRIQPCDYTNDKKGLNTQKKESVMIRWLFSWFTSDIPAASEPPPKSHPPPPPPFRPGSIRLPPPIVSNLVNRETQTPMCVLESTGAQTDKPHDLSISFEKVIARTDVPSPSTGRPPKVVASGIRFADAKPRFGLGQVAKPPGRTADAEKPKLPFAKRETAIDRPMFSLGRDADSDSKPQFPSAAERPKPSAEEREPTDPAAERPKFAFGKFGGPPAGIAERFSFTKPPAEGGAKPKLQFGPPSEGGMDGLTKPAGQVKTGFVFPRPASGEQREAKELSFTLPKPPAQS